MSEKTVFQRIIDREIPSTIIFEDEDIIVITTIEPKAPVHFLGITKQPFKDIHHLLQDAKNAPLLWKLFSRLSIIAESRGLDKSGYKLTVNTGLDAGQTVPHLHVHLLGGKKLGE